MNRSETKLLVENWRKVLVDGIEDSEDFLLEEGRIGNFITSLALGASILLNPNIGNTRTKNQVETGITKAFLDAGTNVEVEVVASDKVKITSSSGKSKIYSMPDTSGFKNSLMDKWFEKRIKTVSDWKNFLDQSTDLFLQVPEGNSFSGAKYKDDLTKKYSNLLEELNDLCAFKQSEIFKMPNDELYLIGYNRQGAPVTWVKFDINRLNKAIDYMKNSNKKNKTKQKMWNLRRVMMSYKNMDKQF